MLTNQNSSFDLCLKEKWPQRIPMNQKYQLLTRKNAKSSPDDYFSSEHMIILIPLFYNSDISGNTFDRKYKSKGCYFIWSRPVHLCKRPGTTKIGFMRTFPNTRTMSHVLLTDRFDKIVTTVICTGSVTRRKLFLSLSLNDLFV